MSQIVLLLLTCAVFACAAELPSKKYLNLAAIKTMAATAEAEMQKRNVQVTICIMDESGNLLFLQKADGAGLNTIQFAQKKAKYAALYGRPSKAAQDSLKERQPGGSGFSRRVSEPGGPSHQSGRQDDRQHRLQRRGSRKWMRRSPRPRSMRC